MVYRRDVVRTLEEFVDHEPQASDLRIPGSSGNVWRQITIELAHVSSHLYNILFLKANREILSTPFGMISQKMFLTPECVTCVTCACFSQV